MVIVVGSVVASFTLPPDLNLKMVFLLILKAWIFVFIVLIFGFYLLPFGFQCKSTKCEPGIYCPYADCAQLYADSIQLYANGIF